MVAVGVVMVHGHGPAFCSGFDLSTAAAHPELLGEYILRLSGVIRRLRRMRPLVVVAVHGAAIAVQKNDVNRKDCLQIPPGR